MSLLGETPAAATDGSDPWAHVQAGDTLRRLGRPAEAEAAYRRADTQGPARLHALMGLAHCAQDRDDQAAALACFTAAAACAPDDPWPHFYVGDTLRRLQRPAEAQDAYRRATAEGPTRLHALLGLGHCAQDRDDAAAALDAFTAAAACAPDDPWPHFYVGHALRRLGRAADAERAYRRALAADPGHYPATLALGGLARGRGDRDAAAALFEQASRLNPAAPDAWLELVRHHRDRGDTNQALALATDLLARTPGHPEAGLALAQLQRQAGQAVAAHATLHAVVAAAPRHVEARIELALLDLQLGRPEPATALLQAVADDAPDPCRALELLAELARTRGDFASALGLLQRAIAARPDNAWPRVYLGQTFAEQGQLPQALAALDAADAVFPPADPSRAVVAAKRIELLRRAGHWQAALELSRHTRAAWPADFPVWVQGFLIELLAGGSVGIAACLAAAPAAGAADQARLAQCRGQAAEAAWQLDAAAGHYAQALATTPDDPWVHMDMARAQMLRLDPVAARAHLRIMAQLQAGTARLAGRSPNVSQTHYGQILDEYELEPDGLAALLALRDRAPAERIPPLLGLLRQSPGFTPAAVALLVALRQSGRLAGPAALATSAAIPRRIAQYWDALRPPADVAAIMHSWAALHPDHTLHRFDHVAAEAFLGARFAPDVLAAYRTARQPAQKADLFRLAWLFAEGGWYVDADDRCLAPLPGLAPDSAGLVAYQEDLGTLANDVLGAVPQHPVIGRALDLAVAAVTGHDEDLIWLATGPGLLTRAFATTLADSRLGLDGWLAHVAVLDRAALFSRVAVHCFTGYKAAGRHWSDSGRRARRRA